MEGIYDVTVDGQPVGTVRLDRQGLYMSVFCCCRIEDGKIHRLYADGEKLGVLIPEGGELVLETKVAAKRLKPGCIFSLDGNQKPWYPICPGEPFAYLDKVRTGRLVIRQGKPGLG